MAEFMGKQNAKQCHRKRDARDEKLWFCEGPEVIGEETIESRRLISSVRGGELRSSGECRERCDNKKTDGHNERTEGTRLPRPN